MTFHPYFYLVLNRELIQVNFFFCKILLFGYFKVKFQFYFFTQTVVLGRRVLTQMRRKDRLIDRQIDGQTSANNQSIFTFVANRQIVNSLIDRQIDVYRQINIDLLCLGFVHVLHAVRDRQIDRYINKQIDKIFRQIDRQIDKY